MYTHIYAPIHNHTFIHTYIYIHTHTHTYYIYTHTILHIHIYHAKKYEIRYRIHKLLINIEKIGKTELMAMFKEILKASRNNQASIFAFTFKFKIRMLVQPLLLSNSLQMKSVTLCLKFGSSGMLRM